MASLGRIGRPVGSDYPLQVLNKGVQSAARGLRELASFFKEYGEYRKDQKRTVNTYWNQSPSGPLNPGANKGTVR